MTMKTCKESLFFNPYFVDKSPCSDSKPTMDSHYSYQFIHDNPELFGYGTMEEAFLTIFMELFENSLDAINKSTHCECPTIHITIKEEDPTHSPPLYSLQICDNGIFQSHSTRTKVLDSIFNPWFPIVLKSFILLPLSPILLENMVWVWRESYCTWCPLPLTKNSISPLPKLRISTSTKFVYGVFHPCVILKISIDSHFQVHTSTIQQLSKVSSLSGMTLSYPLILGSDLYLDHLMGNEACIQQVLQ